MTPIKHQTCEVEIGGVWRSASLVEARGRYNMARMRCSACHGQIVVTGSYTAEKSGLTFQHHRAHDGCPHVPARFRGTPSTHPQAMV